VGDVARPNVLDDHCLAIEATRERAVRQHPPPAIGTPDRRASPDVPVRGRRRGRGDGKRGAIGDHPDGLTPTLPPVLPVTADVTGRIRLIVDNVLHPLGNLLLGEPCQPTHVENACPVVVALLSSIEGSLPSRPLEPI